MDSVSPSSEVKHNDMTKTAICFCPIKFTECVLLLEAAALNYSVDYDHYSATIVTVATLLSPTQTLFSFVKQLALVQDIKFCIRELYLDYNFTRTHQPYMSTGACCTQSEFVSESVPEERKREPDGIRRTKE